MKTPLVPLRIALAIGWLILCSATELLAIQTDITGPTGSGAFGKTVILLQTGNFVVIDPDFDLTTPTTVADVGAVYLYSPTGTLISTLTGSSANDRVGEGGITQLGNSNFVVKSPKWHNGGIADAGAVTWCDSSTGFFGGPFTTVSASNSLVGVSSDDKVGETLITVGLNHYIVVTPSWDDGMTVNVGAVTWCNGSTGATVGPVSASNSLVGSTVHDQVGVSGVRVLPSGNYVVRTETWDNGPEVEAGAVTWVNGSNGRPFGEGSPGAVISSTNSLVGTLNSMFVGGANGTGMVPVLVLANGNYVVNTPYWRDGVINNLGASTWVDGNVGIAGVITPANSLVGTTEHDQIGSKPLALNNGNYVIVSPNWDNGMDVDVGAATWVNGSNGIPFGETAVGAVVSTSNSLVGATPGDQLGGGDPPNVALTFGNYVLVSPSWDNGAATDAGAVTLCNGATGTVGVVSGSGSLTGSSTNDLIGSNGVIPLMNGNYLVPSPEWDNGSEQDAGAATWCSGTTAISGNVSAANSLVGTTTGDKVSSDGFALLTNGNYVVKSSNWHNGAASFAGAATWGNGATGICGTVHAGNSLVGTSIEDLVYRAVPLSNGNYVVNSPTWNNGAIVDAGAVTWGNGTMGVAGTISAANSLVGIVTEDGVGAGVEAFEFNDHYVVRTPMWNNGAAQDAGAVTWCNGTTGRVGTITAANSLVGSTLGENLGEFPVTTYSNGDYVVLNARRDPLVPPPFDTGAMTLCKNGGGTVGVPSSSNSVFGTTASGGFDMTHAYDVAREQLIVGRPADNKVTRVGQAGTIAHTTALRTANEASPGFVGITLFRSGGAEGTATVKLSTAAVSATTTADFLPITNLTITFNPGEIFKTVFVTIVNDTTANEVDETFNIVLSAPTGAALGLATSTVRIIDNDNPDTTLPNAPVITAPAANALIGVGYGGTVTVTGTATDNRGIASVEVKINDAPVFDVATLTSNSGTTASFSATLVPKSGVNTVTVQSIDTRGNTSAPVTRTFTVTRPLMVRTIGGGTITPAGFTPSSFRELGKSLTISATASATPAPGFVFAGWLVSGPAGITQQIGVSSTALDKNTLTFFMREGLQLTANFVANPYSAAVVGTYNGAILPDPALPDRSPTGPGPEDGTLESNSTVGAFNATLMSTGAFSGKLMIDGFTLNCAGMFDHLGRARFGTARTFTVVVPRPNKPSLVMGLDCTLAPPYKITGSVIAKEFQQSVITGRSTVDADRAHFTGLAGGPIVDDDYLTVTGAAPSPTGRTDGTFTVHFPSIPVAAQSQAVMDAGFTPQDYPQGFSVGTMKVSKAGLVTFTGTLADGTAVTNSSTLSNAMKVVLFSSLYSTQGFFLSQVQFDSSQSETDLEPWGGTKPLWSRPFMNTSHYYPYGWAEVLRVNMQGAKYVATAGQSVLKAPDGGDGNNDGDPLQAADADGNIALTFTDGQLAETLVKSANLSIADVATKVPDNDSTFSLTVNRTTGAITGTFSHTDDTVPAFNTIIHQKGPSAGAFGFFLTKQPIPIDYTGESGAVTILGQP